MRLAVPPQPPGRLPGGAVVDGGVEAGAEDGRLQDGGREHDLVGGRVVVRVDGPPHGGAAGLKAPPRLGPRRPVSYQCKIKKAPRPSGMGWQSSPPDASFARPCTRCSAGTPVVKGGLSFCRGTLRAVNTVGVEGREVLFLAIKGSVFRKHHHASRYPSGRRTRQAEHSRCGKSWNSDRTECFSEKRKHSTRVSSAAGIQGCRSIGHVLHHCRSVTSLPLRPIWVRDPPHFAFYAPPPTLPPKLHTQL